MSAESVATGCDVSRLRCRFDVTHVDDGIHFMASPGACLKNAATIRSRLVRMKSNKGVLCLLVIVVCLAWPTQSTAQKPPTIAAAAN
jgi:hypothetical protein